MNALIHELRGLKSFGVHGVFYSPKLIKFFARLISWATELISECVACRVHYITSDVYCLRPYYYNERRIDGSSMNFFT